MNRRKMILGFTFVCLMLMGSPLWSQVPPPPVNHNNEGGPVGGSAPIGDGTWLLIILGSAYGLYKIYPIRQKEINNDQNGLKRNNN